MRWRWRELAAALGMGCALRCARSKFALRAGRVRSGVCVCVCVCMCVHVHVRVGMLGSACLQE